MAVNAQMHYPSPPVATQLFSSVLVGLSLLFLPALLIHVHVQYMSQSRLSKIPRGCWIAVYGFYLIPLIAFSLSWLWQEGVGFRSILTFLVSDPSSNEIGMIPALLLCILVQVAMVRASKDRTERQLFQLLCAISVVTCIFLILRSGIGTIAPLQNEGIATATLLAGILPGALLTYYSLHHNFLEFGEQRNLVYALLTTFLALLYLALVRRVSGWLEPVLPPEATASILLFILIFLFEPLERLMGPTLHHIFRERMDRLQRVAVEIQEQARHGELDSFLAITSQRIRDVFSLADVRISMPVPSGRRPLESPGGLGHVVSIPIVQDGDAIGLLEACSSGAVLTGETTAALEFLAEQLPAAVGLCRLIEEKLRLERELAERERFALLGQMAASISHNLRNPLSAMKTVLQVLMERTDLPEGVRDDCALVVGTTAKGPRALEHPLRRLEIGAAAAPAFVVPGNGES